MASEILEKQTIIPSYEANRWGISNARRRHLAVIPELLETAMRGHPLGHPVTITITQKVEKLDTCATPSEAEREGPDSLLTTTYTFHLQ